MKIRTIIIPLLTALMIIGPSLSVCATEVGTNLPDTDPHTLFSLAGTAYNEGNMNDAIANYQQLVNEGYVAEELFFNLGNAYFRNAEPGEAVVNYLRARQLDPRNADTKANLQFALEHSGALVPPDNIFMKYIQLITFPEWITIAMMAYWIGMLIIAFYTLTHKSGLAIRRILITLAVILAISIIGIIHGINLRIHPVAVVIEPGQKALFAPLEGSTAHFTLPEGSIVRILDHQGSWVRVSAGKQSGWIQQNTCQTTFL